MDRNRKYAEHWHRRHPLSQYIVKCKQLRTNSLLHGSECRSSGEEGGEQCNYSLHGVCIIIVSVVML